MSDERSSTDRALDILVYAPVGLAFEALDALPRLARRGRGQVGLARVAGHAAASRGQSEVEKATATVVELLGALAKVPGPAEPGIDAVALPRGYDDMSAAEIVEMLEGLSRTQRARIAAHERATRSRVTVLRRIEELDG